MKKYFCTFADSKMKKASLRIEKQAKDLDFFDEVFIYSTNELDQEFKEIFKNKFSLKSYIIEGDRVLMENPFFMSI